MNVNYEVNSDMTTLTANNKLPDSRFILFFTYTYTYRTLSYDHISYDIIKDIRENPNYSQAVKDKKIKGIIANDRQARRLGVNYIDKTDLGRWVLARELAMINAKPSETYAETLQRAKKMWHESREKDFKQAELLEIEGDKVNREIREIKKKRKRTNKAARPRRRK